MSYKVKSEKAAQNNQFRTFEDLEVYQVAREFRKRMYAVGRELPDFEKYALGDQIRRASVSLTNNIAEGHGRYHFADQVKFLLASRGSLQELIDDLNTCYDEHYLDPERVTDLKTESWRVLALLNGYLRYLRDRKLDKQSTVQETNQQLSAEDDETLTLLEAALTAGSSI